jgi:hypothetical protein
MNMQTHLPEESDAMPDQRVLLTTLPNGFSANGDRARISVLISPRLGGATRLADFPDFLNWTRKLRDGGVDIHFRIGASDIPAAVSTASLRPDLWEAIFAPDTRVDPHRFDDYADRLIVSYPHQQALMTLKSLYQICRVALATPLPRAGAPGRGRSLRDVLMEQMEGFSVGWNDRIAIAERNRLREEQMTGGGASAPIPPGRLGGDGLPIATRMPDATATDAMTRRFALYHHLPPAPNMTRPPMDEVLDFHRALTALSAYPSLMRALGLVLDATIDRGSVPFTPGGQCGEIAVSVFECGPWFLAPQASAPNTAYHHLDGPSVVFATASALGPTSGLLPLQTDQFGLAQIDVDSGMHKAIMLAESLATVEPPPHPEVLDTSATLPSLRSGGLALVANDRARGLLAAFRDARVFNDLLEQGHALSRPFFAEDLVRGYRLDIWDARRDAWRSLHRRDGTYRFGEDGALVFSSKDEEGFTQLAVATAAPDAQRPSSGDLYLHEVVARWTGWSLSAPRPGKSLSRSADPDNVIAPDDPDDPAYDPENPAATPFKMQASFATARGSLPRLRFGQRYRLRARLVDLAGNSIAPDDPAAGAAAESFGAPADPEGFAYLRYEPVNPPELALRAPEGVSGPGSAIDRLVIRTFNSDPSLDAIAPTRTASDRHIAPPRASVELAERHGLFDDPVTGKMLSDPATRDLIALRDAGQFPTVTAPVAGKPQSLPIEPSDQIVTLPYIPDPLARGAALRDLPGAPMHTVGKLELVGATEALKYKPLPDANPRPGSATLIDFGHAANWQSVRPFRLALDEGDGPPQWDANQRALMVYLPKATMAVLPLSSYIGIDDLKRMGVWQWLREEIEEITLEQAQAAGHRFPFAADDFAHIVQRTTEGGHWMLTPPHIVTLVHAVQQPLGHPEFLTPRSRHPGREGYQQSLNMMGPSADAVFDTMAVWRAPGALDSFLIGGLRVHGASTAKIDLLADWEDPVDDPSAPEPATQLQSWRADEAPLHEPHSGWLFTGSGATQRTVGYYDQEHDIIWFARQGDRWGDIPPSEAGVSGIAAPLHHFADTRHHIVRYVAVATSRFREYFAPEANLDYTRSSEPVTVHVPASARPAPPRVVKVLPTFGWDRQTATNLKSSVRFGRGLRVYLERPWYSSGADELLGVTLWNGGSPPDDAQRDAWKMVIRACRTNRSQIQSAFQP